MGGGIAYFSVAGRMRILALSGLNASGERTAQMGTFSIQRVFRGRRVDDWIALEGVFEIRRWSLVAD